MAPYSRHRRLAYILILSTLWVLPRTAYARNEVLGEVQLQGAGKVEKDSGVWVDGQRTNALPERTADVIFRMAQRNGTRSGRNAAHTPTG